MRSVAFISHPDCSLHTCDGHPEHAGRLTAIYNYLDRMKAWKSLVRLEARPASADEVKLNHDSDYVDSLLDLSVDRVRFLDPDTYFTPHSQRAALLAYGAGLSAIEEVTAGRVERAFCCVRPPGHHAERDRAMGFCLFNNIAGAARFALTNCGVERIGIVDIDVHHGNGTQAAFYSDPTVHFTSWHQYPFYPGTGAASETGEGEGKGLTHNLPLSAGTTGQEALEQLKPVLENAFQSFRPQLLLISAGFDAHREDPLASLLFEDEDYYQVTKFLTQLADRHCRGRIVSLLEGGYNLDALGRSVYQHLKGLWEDD